MKNRKNNNDLPDGTRLQAYEKSNAAIWL